MYYLGRVVFKPFPFFSYTRTLWVCRLGINCYSHVLLIIPSKYFTSSTTATLYYIIYKTASLESGVGACAYDTRAGETETRGLLLKTQSSGKLAQGVFSWLPGLVWFILYLWRLVHIHVVPCAVTVSQSVHRHRFIWNHASSFGSSIWTDLTLPEMKDSLKRGSHGGWTLSIVVSVCFLWYLN